MGLKAASHDKPGDPMRAEAVIPVVGDGTVPAKDDLSAGATVR
jgi:hypothetical protein